MHTLTWLQIHTHTLNKRSPQGKLTQCMLNRSHIVSPKAVCRVNLIQCCWGWLVLKGTKKHTDSSGWNTDLFSFPLLQHTHLVLTIENMVFGSNQYNILFIFFVFSVNCIFKPKFSHYKTWGKYEARVVANRLIMKVKLSCVCYQRPQSSIFSLTRACSNKPPTNPVSHSFSACVSLYIVCSKN